MTDRLALPPPAAWIARALAPRDDAAALVVDLEDEFTRVSAARGRPAAHRWLLWELAHSLRPLARGATPARGMEETDAWMGHG